VPVLLESASCRGDCPDPDARLEARHAWQNLGAVRRHAREPRRVAPRPSGEMATAPGMRLVADDAVQLSLGTTRRD
jgi:hypothetical protein